ncbi:hypothetical protein [Conexibacter sp. SYSU D00693]|uniref:hypothetical protein n=1 Tax=Conexibacter sp. SYSU D00693 TaxID=2812560 RepID=UPI00196A2359|nr:hypothetical protein [Conexibacter sp. SYSU D00693]
MRRLLVLLAVALAAVTAGSAAVAPAPAQALVVGIGDQKPDMFADPLFAETGIRHARLAVSWDAMNHPWQVRELDAWLQGAKAAGVQPLVGFWHSRTNRRSLPKPELFKFQFRKFRARYPWVTTFATWNEANHCGEPTCNRPALVAAYWKAMRRECRSCRVLASELLDMPNMAKWVRSFRRAAGFDPGIWGLHNYIDANRFRTSGTRALLRATRGKVWFTETGGIVKRRTKVNVPLNESSAHAAKATRWVFDKLVPLDRKRIQRVYLYHWNTPPGRQSWDSGLVNQHDQPRAAFRVLRKVLRRLAPALPGVPLGQATDPSR